MTHDPKLVLVSACLCLVGSWTAVTLLSRARLANSRLENVWTVAAAIVFGASVWGMHFIAMLAMRSDFAVSYDLAWTVLSIAIAAGSSFAGFEIAIQTGRRWLGGAVIGLGVGGMHFAGMQAMQGSFRLNWNPSMIALSLGFGVGLCALAMECKRKLPSRTGRAAAAALFTLGIAGLHFIGMMAVSLLADSRMPSGGHNFPPEELAVVVAAVALLIVFVGLSSAYLDLYLEKRRSDESVRLRAHISELEATKLELGLALETAFAANKSKTAFLAAMSHELRTPLNAVNGF